MGQAILKVDFVNKKLITEQQNNSDFYKNKHELCDGEVTIFTTTNSGGNWQMRMRVQGHRQYHQKSLRTKNFETAKERAKIEHAIATVKVDEGKSLFSPTLFKAIQLYLEHRAKDVLAKRITKGRFSTIKTQIKWLTKYPTINTEHRLDTLGKKTIYDYQQFRLGKYASNQTIRNELATINHFCKWAKEEGLHNTEKFLYPTIKIVGTEAEAMRRRTFTDEEYSDICKWLRTYCSLKQIKADKLDDDKAFVRHLFRSYFLIHANTMMRSGELFGLKWKNVKVYEKDNYKWAEIIVEGETSKVRKDRVFVARGGNHFERLKRLSKHTKGSDFVFTLNDSTHWHALNRRALEYHFKRLLQGVGITDAKERKLQLYSCRHYGISKRVNNGANIVQLAKDCGTSVEHITKTYYHSNLRNSERNMAIMYEE